MNSISLKDVRYQIKDKVILNDVSLDFSDRRLTGIIGNNGSGKTTLLRLILGAISLTSGKIEINERNISSYKRKELARMIAILSQNTFSDFSFPCQEVAMMGRNPHRGRFQPFTAEDHEITIESMRLTDTYKFKDRLITQLSGGEEQTVFLARALTQTPRFLLLDEPTSHLDIYHQIRILELVKSLTTKMGAVIVIHDLNMAARFCDQLILMSEGQIVSQGIPEEVLTPPNIERVFNIRSVTRYDPELQTVQLTFLSHRNFSQELIKNEAREARYV